MPKNIGYLLPDGDAYTDELRCALVFYPAKDEYLYALGGSLDYLGTWLAWERDTLKRGKDAARAWAEATVLTRECWTMAYCDDILNTLLRIEALLSEGTCCDGSTTVGDITTVTTTIIPGVGDPPATWGETPVSDWDDWLEYVCYHANKFVDQLVSSAETLDTIAEIGHWTVEFFANIIRALQFLTLVYPVSYAAMLSIKESFLAAGDMSDDFDDVASKYEASRNDIVCAFISGASVSDAVETALDDATLWTLLYQFNNYDSTQALVYEGTVDGSVYLPPVQRDDCECEELEPGQLIPNPSWDDNSDGWTHDTCSPNYVWTADQDGEPGCLVTLASVSNMDYACLKSPNFTIPLGITEVTPQARIQCVTGRDFTVYIRLHRASDDVPVSNTFNVFNQQDYEFHTVSLPVHTATPGQEVYARVRVQVTGPTSSVRLSHIKCWYVP